jgi:hypothetical protein
MLEGGYLGGAGAKVSRLRPGSGFGLGLGAFLTSFLPLSLLPMGRSVTQKGLGGKGIRAQILLPFPVPGCIPPPVSL